MFDIPYISSLAKKAETVAGEDVRFAAGASPAEIDAFISRRGVPLPESFRAWIEICNGGNVFILWHGLSCIESCYEAYTVWPKRKWIPCAGDGSGNDWVIIPDHATGCFPVVFIDQCDIDKPAYVVASSFEVFLKEMLEYAARYREVCWYGDPEVVKHRDPDLLKFTNYSFPWTTEE